MPNLQKSFLHYDQGMLQIIAEKWDIELHPGSPSSLLSQLKVQLSQADTFSEVLSLLTKEARIALQKLVANGGQQPLAEFSRVNGKIRVMGSAKREREHPDRYPISVSEQLYYSGLIAIAFLQLSEEPQEYAYIPDEILLGLQSVTKLNGLPPGIPAALPLKEHVQPATSILIDDVCTYLAALRIGLNPEQHQDAFHSINFTLLYQLLRASNLLDASDVPDSHNTRLFLENNRAESLLFLLQHWLQSEDINELHHLSHLLFEGYWKNSTLTARHTVIHLLQRVPPNTWWNLESFIAAVKTEMPDFQRPAGDYDSWFIRRAADERYLRGFAFWDEIDGALIRYLITVPMHYLGLIDLAAPAAGSQPNAFRWSAWSSSLLTNQVPPIREPAASPIKLLTSGLLHVPRTASRSVRYQLARFCEWEGLKDNIYRFRISHAGLVQAVKQRLQPSQMIALLQKSAEPPLPSGILNAIHHWEKAGSATQLQSAMLIRVESAVVLEKLQASRAGRYISEVINPTTCVIRPGGKDFIRDTLVEMGYLLEIADDV